MSGSSLYDGISRGFATRLMLCLAINKPGGTGGTLVRDILLLLMAGTISYIACHC